MTFLFGAALISGSLYLSYLLIFVAILDGGMAVAATVAAIMGIGFCFTVGVLLLWEDFIEPLFRKPAKDE